MPLSKFSSFSCILFVIAPYLCCYHPRSDHHLLSCFPVLTISVWLSFRFDTPVVSCHPTHAHIRVGSLDSAVCMSPLRLRLFYSRHTPKLVRLTRMNHTRLALLWFSKAACTVWAPGVRSRRPPRLAYLTISLASTARQGLGLASL